MLFALLSCSAAAAADEVDLQIRCIGPARPRRTTLDINFRPPCASRRRPAKTPPAVDTVWMLRAGRDAAYGRSVTGLTLEEGARARVGRLSFTYDLRRLSLV